ncbi:MAG: hypothetical protein HYV02_08025 [Deltaproteobacteria bacterium]|nr:hypothetical protein [Deltaproteobacteria bacterium]
MNQQKRQRRIYVHGAYSVTGTVRRLRRAIMRIEGISATQETAGHDRTVACLAAWSADAKMSLLREAITGALERASMPATIIDGTVFCCTLPMTHFPAGRSLVRSILQPIGVSGPYLHLGGHQCSGTIAAMRQAAHWLTTRPYSHVLVATVDVVDFTTHRTLGNGVIQGDAASAVILSHAPAEIAYVGTHVITDASRYDMSGAGDELSWRYFFTLRSLVHALLVRHGITIEQVAHVIPHISNPVTWQRIRELLQFHGQILLQREMETLGHLFGTDCVLGLMQFVAQHPPTSTYALALTYGMGASWGGLLVQAQ